ncbi:MAG: site-specific integrase [Candidatus Thiodiazotropha lotti]|nr:site-specific integrase [Candidatus Thiodiazotropha lotti]
MHNLTQPSTTTTFKAKAKVFSDNTGIESELPILITERGVLEPLLDYCLVHQHDRSESWMERVVHATCLLMQYMDANQDCFDDPQKLFQSFAQRLYTGTIGNNGLDPSGLYWLPASTKTTYGLILSLTGLTDWLADRHGTKPMNPLRKADRYEQRLNYAAWFRRNQHNFLGHIKNKTVNQTVRKARHIRGRRALVTLHDDAVAFPEALFAKFYLEGIGGVLDRRVAVRNQLILLMMHFAGCRKSDTLHLWVEDVLFDPHNKDSVIVRLYHPEDGKAPDNWHGTKGTTNRAAYLRVKYALTPRNRLSGTQRVGWKYQVVDHKDNYIQLHWFPQEAGILFAKLWREYCQYLLVVNRNHPYAFISFERRSLGNPLTINALKDAYKKALLRIGEMPAKIEGRSSHAHRHAMGRRLEKADVNPRVIQKVMHHKSIASQVPYTAPGIERVTQALTDSYTALEHKARTGETNLTLPNWDKLLRHGYEDIDPDGLFSGLNPKLKRHK